LDSLLAIVRFPDNSVGDKIKVFLVDSGRTILAEEKNVIALPQQLVEESQRIKQLSFLFQLKVRNSSPVDVDPERSVTFGRLRIRIYFLDLDSDPDKMVAAPNNVFKC
jgi:hypothetical protein